MRFDYLCSTMFISCNCVCGGSYPQTELCVLCAFKLRGEPLPTSVLNGAEGEMVVHKLGPPAKPLSSNHFKGCLC